MSKPQPHRSAAPASLHYAPARAWQHRVRGRPLILAATLAAVTIFAWLWGGLTWRKVQLLYWQSRCMTYTAPPQRQIGAAGPGSVPREWERYYALYSPPGMLSEATIYLHERTSPGGNRRLVVLDVLPTGGGPTMRVVMPRVFVPGGLFSSPREILTGSIPKVTYSPGDRVFAGQSDPLDPSHFTFVIESSEGRQVIDGWLVNNDTVTLEPRTPQPFDSADAAAATFRASPSSAFPPPRAPAAPAERRSSGR